MLNEAKEKTEDKMELTTKKITLTEIWPCGGEGEEMALKCSSLFSNI